MVSFVEVLQWRRAGERIEREHNALDDAIGNAQPTPAQQMLKKYFEESAATITRNLAELKEISLQSLRAVAASFEEVVKTIKGFFTAIAATVKGLYLLAKQDLHEVNFPNVRAPLRRRPAPAAGPPGPGPLPAGAGA